MPIHSISPRCLPGRREAVTDYACPTASAWAHKESFKHKAAKVRIMAVAPVELAAFLLFALLTAGSSLGVVLVRDVWHSALLLGVALVSVAVHYVMLRAEFLAAMQILVYVGGVLILITFAVMLVREQDEGLEVAG